MCIMMLVTGQHESGCIVVVDSSDSGEKFVQHGCEGEGVHGLWGAGVLLAEITPEEVVAAVYQLKPSAHDGCGLRPEPQVA